MIHGREFKFPERNAPATALNSEERRSSKINSLVVLLVGIALVAIGAYFKSIPLGAVGVIAIVGALFVVASLLVRRS